MNKLHHQLTCSFSAAAAAAAAAYHLPHHHQAGPHLTLVLPGFSCIDLYLPFNCMKQSLTAQIDLSIWPIILFRKYEILFKCIQNIQLLIGGLPYRKITTNTSIIND